jgi:hypothetical protein
LSSATVHRRWQKYGLQPHRVDTFKFSRDPEFDSKLADIVGLYLDPPERALVLCANEKSQIQALNRTQLALPMWPGLPARMIHDYTRHGTTSLFAALEVASGKVHGRCFPRHTHVEFLAFLKSLSRCYPEQAASHLRQLQNPQAPCGKRMACRPSSHQLALHAEQRVLAEPNGRAMGL